MSFFSIVHVEPAAFRSNEGRTEWRRLSAAGAAYRDHCLLWRLFPSAAPASPTSDQEQAGFVYRRRDSTAPDPYTAARPPLSYYVVSSERPQPVRGMLTLATKPYDPVLRAGEFVRFQLRANPSAAQRRARADGIRRRPSAHHDVIMQAKRDSHENENQALAMNTAAVDWLTGRAPHWGLEIELEQLFSDGYTQHRLRRGGETISFSSLDYSGVARVADPDLLRAAMLRGVGRKRGFGCGLLLVKRLE